mmetsp:Transcript_2005/g.4482  ORF Transcript_2005/g.4482 Transcript_2005/m.4482 type:complete len:236 (+) Transcript_2005:1139-1846(+)
MLGLGLPFHERCGHGGTRLDHRELVLRALRDGIHAPFDGALVLVPPHDEVHAVGQQRLLDVALHRDPCPTGQPVLVDRHQVEPRVSLRSRRSRHRDFLAVEAARQPLVPHVAEPVERQLGRSLLDEDRRECDLLDVGGAAEVVDEVSGGEEVEGRQAAVTSRVVVVAVDGEDRQLDVVVRVLVVHLAVLAMKVRRLVTDDLELDLPIPQAVVAQHLHAPLQGLARWLVVVEEVAR